LTHPVHPLVERPTQSPVADPGLRPVRVEALLPESPAFIVESHARMIPGHRTQVQHHRRETRQKKGPGTRCRTRILGNLPYRQEGWPPVGVVCSAEASPTAIACSTRRISVALVDARSRASHCTIGMSSLSVKASRTSLIEWGK